MVNRKKLIFFCVTSNGIGHLKRVINLVKILKKHQVFSKFFIYVDKKVLEELSWDKKIYLKSKNVNWIFYKKNFSNDHIINFYKNFNLIKNNKFFLNSNVVVSDNLALPLKYRKDTILMGSFLWSDVIKNEKLNKYLLQEKKILKKTKPPMICLKGVNCIKDKNIKKIEVNWMLEKADINKGNNFNILIAPSKFYDSKIINKIIKHLQKQKDINLYLPNNLGKNHKNYKKFYFTKKNFSKINFAILRPGIGAIEDCIAYRIYMLSINKGDNFEIKNNFIFLKRKKIISNINDSFFKNNFKSYLQKINFNYIQFQKTIKKEKLGGYNKIVKILKNQIYDRWANN